MTYAQGNYPKAYTRLRESVALFKEIGGRWEIAELLNNLGNAALALSNFTEAHQAYREALHTAMEAQIAPFALDALVGIAMLQIVAQLGLSEATFEMLASVLRHPAITGWTKDRTERLWAELEGQLSSQQIEAAYNREVARPFEIIASEVIASEIPTGTRHAAEQNVAAHSSLSIEKV